MLICIEGIDASGKATQAKLLAETLGGTVFDFPRYQTETGALIKSMLMRHAWMGGYVDHPPDGARAQALVLQSLMTVNRYEHVAQLAAWAASPDVVVLDRYWLSGYAYGVADGLDGAWLEALHAALPQPDAWILLDVSPEASMVRRPERRDAYEADAGRLVRARAAYLDYFVRRDAAESGRWHILDGERPAEAVESEVLAVAVDVVKRRRRRHAVLLAHGCEHVGYRVYRCHHGIGCIACMDACLDKSDRRMSSAEIAEIVNKHGGA